MQTTDYILLVAVLLLSEVGARIGELVTKAAENAKDAAWWESEARRCYAEMPAPTSLDKLSDQQVARLYHDLAHGFPDEAPFVRRDYLDAVAFRIEGSSDAAIAEQLAKVRP